jgi:hypothetical protein
MQKTIKLAYDWYAPEFPLNNNQSSFVDAIEKARKINDKDRKNTINNTLFPYRSLEIFSKDDTYEYVTSASIKDNDYFIYEFAFEIRDLNQAIFNNTDIFSLTHISDFILDQIKTKNGYILIDVSHETIVMYHNYEQNILFLLHEYFKARDIPLYKIIFLIGSVNAPDIYRKYCIQSNIPGRERMVVKNYEWFEYQCSKELNELENIPKPNDNIFKVKKTFLCYNRRYKPHRTDLYVLFWKFDLLNNSFYSMPHKSTNDSTHPVKNIDFASNYNIEETSSYDIIATTKQMFKSADIMNNDKMKELCFTLPAVIDTRKDLKDMIKIIDPEQAVYDSALISVITESNFYTEDVFNTEKTWKAIANRHPFILVGPKHSLKYLKSLGYKTFSDFFDESYDDIENPTARLMAIVKLCRDIENWDFNKKRDFFNETVSVTEYNFNLLKSVYNNKKKLVLEHITHINPLMI